MQIPKNHHYIPQFYLKNWETSENNIISIRNINGKIVRRPVGIRSAGSEEHLYSYDEKLATSNRAEIETNFFSPLDNFSAPILKKFINNVPTSQIENFRWGIFVLAFKIRLPAAVAAIKARTTDALVAELDRDAHEYAAVRGPNDPATLREYLEMTDPGLIESYGLRLLPELPLDRALLTQIAQFHWFRRSFDHATVRLITSDHPITFTHNLRDRDCVIALPISPSVAIFGFRSASSLGQSIMHDRQSSAARWLNDRVCRLAMERAFCQGNTDAPDNFFIARLRISQIV